MIEETTPVFMTQCDVDKYMLFQKYYDIFNTLDKKGVFNMDFGKVTINIAYGEIQNIVEENMIWKLSTH